jgi:energy-converting hydrogenase Eha subunit A
MFLFHLRDVLLGIAIFSLPVLLLELQLLVIGLNGMSVNVMIVTAGIGLLSAIGAVVIEMIDA